MRLGLGAGFTPVHSVDLASYPLMENGFLVLLENGAGFVILEI